MPRAIWKGAVSFGMVSIPIKLYTATDEKDVSFNLLHKKDGARIKQQRYCPEDDAVIEWNDVARGYEIAPDQYVIMEPEDFEKVPVDTTHTIEITDFVPSDQIDPIYYQKTYYLEPDKVGGKPFALLREVLKDSKLVALAKVTLRQKEQLCTLRVYNNTIALETMFYADEIRATDDLEVPGGSRHRRERAADGEVARRHADRRLRAGEVSRQLPRGAAGADRAQVRGPGDQAARARRRQGHRPHGGAARQRRGRAAREGGRRPPKRAPNPATLRLRAKPRRRRAG